MSSFLELLLVAILKRGWAGANSGTCHTAYLQLPSQMVISKKADLVAVGLFLACKCDRSRWKTLFFVKVL